MGDWYDTLEEKADAVQSRVGSALGRFGARLGKRPVAEAAQPAAPAAAVPSQEETAKQGILALPRAALKARRTLLDALGGKKP